MILYLSYWFPARERARAVGFFMSAIAISYAIGAPISGGIMSVFDGVGGLADWQWLFLIEALPAVLAGFFVLAWLDDGPREATWLEEDEKSWLARRLEGEERARLAEERHTVGEALKDGRVIAISRHSDRTGDRKGHVSASLAIAAAAFVISTVVGPLPAVAALAVGLFFLLGAHPVFWTMPAALLSGSAAAAGIALINSIGNIGGFVGPYLVGLVEDATGSTDGGLISLAVILVLGAALATRVAHDPALERAPREARFTREGVPAPARRTQPVG